MGNGVDRHRQTSPTLSASPTSPARWAVRIAVVGALLAPLAWGYWSTIVELFKEWQRNDDYSVGQLVPLVAVFLLWRERGALRRCRLRPCWWGLGLIAVALAARAYGLLFLYESAERYSLVLMIAAVVLTVAGRQVFARTFWILLFLSLMVPLPGRVHNAVSGRLQTFSTTGSVFVLEVFGITVTRQGHVIVLSNNTPMAVAEACSGLRMLTAFIVVAATLACLVRRPRWQKAALLASSIPIAIVCNVIRLDITAVLFLVTSGEIAKAFFHDFAGLTMMPMAVIIMFAELWLLDKLVVSSEAESSQENRNRPKTVPKAPRKKATAKSR